MVARTVLLFAALAVLPALAPPTPQERENTILGGYSGLGILQYCKARGLASDEAIAKMRDMLSGLSATPPARAAEIEAKGKAGIFWEDGKETPIEQAAKEDDVTIPELCAGTDAAARQ